MFIFLKIKLLQQFFEIQMIINIQKKKNFAEQVSCLQINVYGSSTSWCKSHVFTILHVKSTHMDLVYGKFIPNILFVIHR